MTLNQRESGTKLGWKDYIALAIAALETIMIPLIILIVVIVVLVLIVR